MCSFMAVDKISTNKIQRVNNSFEIDDMFAYNFYRDFKKCSLLRNLFV